MHTASAQRRWIKKDGSGLGRAINIVSHVNLAQNTEHSAHINRNTCEAAGKCATEWVVLPKSNLSYLPPDFHLIPIKFFLVCKVNPNLNAYFSPLSNYYCCDVSCSSTQIWQKRIGIFIIALF